MRWRMTKPRSNHRNHCLADVIGFFPTPFSYKFYAFSSSFKKTSKNLNGP